MANAIFWSMTVITRTIVRVSVGLVT